jgi:hypothetical protein
VTVFRALAQQVQFFYSFILGTLAQQVQFFYSFVLGALAQQVQFFYSFILGALAQLARVLDWQSKGHRFDSGMLHVKNQRVAVFKYCNPF